MMTKIFEAMIPEAQEDLIRDGIIELVTVLVEAVPHPDRPDDPSAMRVAAEVYHGFREGVPAIETGLAALRGTCSVAAEDITPAVQDRLLADLARDRRQKDEWREGKVNGEPIALHSSPEVADLLRPELFDLDSKVTIWCHAWTAGMSDDGLMLVDCDRPFIAEGIDDESRARILERVYAVDAGIAAIVGPLMREG
jgi:hypothetical protein